MKTSEKFSLVTICYAEIEVASLTHAGGWAWRCFNLTTGSYLVNQISKHDRG